jgi:hypothetical protein
MIESHRHLCWIGGSPGAGKSSITRLLARQYGTWGYYCDWHQLGHEVLRTSRIAEFPALAAWNRKSLDDRWVHTPPEQMAREVLAVWEERFPLVVADLDKVPAGTCVVEGAGCLPNQVLSLTADPQNAVWLVSTPDFVRRVRVERYKQGESLALQTSDPPRALNNIIERDIILSAVVQTEAARLGGVVVPVDGTRSVESIAGDIEQYFRIVPLARYSGRYVDTRGRSVSIEWSGDDLTLSLGSAPYPLHARGDGTFRLEDGPFIGESVQFELDSIREVRMVRIASSEYLRNVP